MLTLKKLSLRLDLPSRRKRVFFTLEKPSDFSEHALSLQKEDFSLRLEQEVKDAFERGRRQGFTEGLGAKAEGGTPAMPPPIDDKADQKLSALQEQVWLNSQFYLIARLLSWKLNWLARAHRLPVPSRRSKDKVLSSSTTLRESWWMR